MIAVGFPLIGGSHQFLHGLPVAAALSRRAGVQVRLFTLSDADAAIARETLASLGAEAVSVTVLHLPWPARQIVDRIGTARTFKVPRLLWWQRAIRRCDCIVALERTSALLARLPGRCPPMVQIPHGVGGPRRAGGGGVDRRFAAFDLALVAGEADRRTTIAAGLLPPERVAVVGQLKMSGLQQIGRLVPRRVFANDRPTILYNPHFHPRRGSWHRYGRALIEAVRQDGGFNLIVAPHMRLFAGAGAAEGAALEALSDPEWLLVDTGSQRLTDMTWTLGADIYLGDFSSQLFEWLVIPRPCVFIDQLGDGGHGDTLLPRMWSLGETVTDAAELVPALHRAAASHTRYAARQAATMRDAVGEIRPDAADLAADRILDLLRRRRPSDR